MSHPILYDAMETNFGHLGLGILRDAISCVVSEERNGLFDLEMEYPLTGLHADKLVTDNLIKVDAGHRLKEQRFRIKRIDKKSDGVINVYAQHMSYITKDLALPPEMILNNHTAQAALNAWRDALIGGNHGMRVSTDIIATRNINLTIKDYQNARQFLGGVRGSLLDLFGGEYMWDNEHIHLLHHRGGNANTLISYGRNITDLSQEQNITTTFTSIYPFAIYKSERGEDIITIPETIVDSKHVNSFPNRRVLSVDFSDRFQAEERPTVERLRELAKSYITNNRVGVPRVSMSVSFVDLTKTLEFSGTRYEELNLCDIVPVRFEKLGIDTEAKIVRIKWNVLLDQYDEIHVGDLRPNLGDRIRDLEREVQEVANDANYALTAANGKNTVFFGPVEPRPPLRVGDLWYRPNGEHTELWTWNGAEWEFVMSTAPDERLREEIAREMARVEKELDRLNDELENEVRPNLEENARILEGLQRELKELDQKLVVLDERLRENENEIDSLNTSILPSLRTELDRLNQTTLPNVQILLEKLEMELSGLNDLTSEWRYLDTVEIDGGAIRANTITTGHMQANTINGDRIATNSLNADRLVVNSITGNQINANAIGAGHIAANSIITSHMRVDTIDGDRLRVNTMNGDRITANTITGNRIVAEAITTNHMRANTISGDRIATSSLNANRIIAETITTGHMRANTIDGDRIAANTITGNRIVASAITANHIATNAITANMITTGELNAGNVRIINLDAARITSGSFAAERIASNAIIARHIHTDALEARHIRAGLVRADRITTHEMHGDRIRAGTLNADRIAANSITAGRIATDAIQARHISTGAITANMITTGTLSANRISGGTLDARNITVANLSANSITGGTLSASRISGGTLDARNITVANLSANSITGGTLSASRISGGTLDARNISVANLSANSITGGTLSASRISGGTISSSVFLAQNGSNSIDIRSNRSVPASGGWSAGVTPALWFTNPWGNLSITTGTVGSVNSFRLRGGVHVGDTLFIRRSSANWDATAIIHRLRNLSAISGTVHIPRSMHGDGRVASWTTVTF